MSSGLHAKYPLFVSDLVKIEFYQQFFEKYSNIKFCETPSNGRMLFLMDGRT